jgi:hypothetical protein
MIAINPEPVIGMPGTLIGIVRNPHADGKRNFNRRLQGIDGEGELGSPG